MAEAFARECGLTTIRLKNFRRLLPSNHACRTPEELDARARLLRATVGRRR